METDTTQPSEELSALNRRLTAVERDLSVLTKTVATKEDVIELKSHISRVEITLAGAQATLLNMEKHFATKADMSALETRIMKWMITTLVGVAALNSSMVLIVVKLVHV